MKSNLIIGLLLMLGSGLVYGLGISGVDITLQIEAKSQEKKQMSTALCYSGWEWPASESHNLAGTLKLNLSADSTAIGFSFQGLKQWVEVKLDGKGDSSVDFGAGWKRRSL